MTHSVQPITVDERGNQRHPAFGLIGAIRGQVTRMNGQGGAVLFDSDIAHTNIIRVRVKAASRKRDLHHDWIHGEEEFVEVEMSEAQWASFVSTMNVGEGVPCTVKYLNGKEIPELPVDSRLASTMEETRAAAHHAFDEIQEALRDFDAPGQTPAQRKRRLEMLRAKINNAVPNVNYAGMVLVEQTENVVTKARADIEAYVVAKATQLGISPAELGSDPPVALNA